MHPVLAETRLCANKPVAYIAPPRPLAHKPEMYAPAAPLHFPAIAAI
jgi:hypothetical protein